MRTWKSAVEAAREALESVAQDGKGTGKETLPPQAVPLPSHEGRQGDASHEGRQGDASHEGRQCGNCAHYLEGGCCGAGHELECMDEGFEAWEPADKTDQ